MKIAIPLENGLLCSHFGHCQEFALIDADSSAGTLGETTSIPAPPHQPGMLPGWLAEQGAEAIIAGGIGQKAIMLFDAAGIKVYTGAPAWEPAKLAQAFLDGSLPATDNTCDHDAHGGGCGGH